MTPGEYEIAPYRPEFVAQVAHLQQHLLGADVRGNLSYLQWKYHDNPYTRAPLGAVVLYHGEIVGFRGIYVNKFEIPGINLFDLLSPADTCIHPAHRRKGLFTAMIRFQMKEYAPQYLLFLNTTVNKNSLPGDLKAGYLPLATRAYASRCTLAALARYILAGQAWLPLEASRIRTGRFGDILVSHEPRPEEMALLVAGQKSERPKIQLVQDEAFFHWRFNNPRGKYVFYYRMQDNAATAYVVIGVSPNNRRGYILDYIARDTRAIAEILCYVIQARHFDILSALRYCVDDTLWSMLHSLGFRMTSLVRLLERVRVGELPLLIRPVKERFSEEDFFVAGLDMRRLENWAFKPICSDAV